MKPAWDDLMDKYKDHATVLVGDVDCTAEGKDLCDANGVRGYPTIKYGDPAALEDYQGGRSADDLSKFAADLKPSCSPTNLDVCDDEQKASIEKIQAMSADDLNAEIKKSEDAMEAAEENFKTEVGKLQAAYEKLSGDKEAELTRIKNSGLGLMKAVRAAAGKAGDKDL